MASTRLAEAMRMIAECRLEVGVQNHPDHFSEQFIRPDREAERTFLAILFGDGDASCWLPSVAFISQGFNDRVDFLE